MLCALEDFDHARCYLANTRKPLLAAPSLALGLDRARREARRADLLHVVGDTSALLCAPLYRRHPAVWGTHGLHLLRRTGEPLGRLVRRRLRTTVARSRQTVCSSLQELDELSALVGPALTPKLTEVANGVALDALPTADERAQARRRLGLDATTLVALYVGELEPRKRPLDAIAAVEAVAERGVPVVLLLAGGGPLAEPVTARAGDTVRALGFRSDTDPLFAAADVFLLPSEREGLSLALLEAMASGLAVVASDAPGNSDAIGEAGLLHRLGDVDALAAILTNLADHPDELRRLGASARHWAEERYSLDRFLDQMHGVFEASIPPS